MAVIALSSLFEVIISIAIFILNLACRILSCRISLLWPIVLRLPHATNTTITTMTTCLFLHAEALGGHRSTPTRANSKLSGLWLDFSSTRRAHSLESMLATCRFYKAWACWYRRLYQQIHSSSNGCNLSLHSPTWIALSPCTRWSYTRITYSKVIQYRSSMLASTIFGRTNCPCEVPDWVSPP